MAGEAHKKSPVWMLREGANPQDIEAEEAAQELLTERTSRDSPVDSDADTDEEATLIDEDELLGALPPQPAKIEVGSSLSVTAVVVVFIVIVIVIVSVVIVVVVGVVVVVVVCVIVAVSVVVYYYYYLHICIHVAWLSSLRSV